MNGIDRNIYVTTHGGAVFRVEDRRAPFCRSTSKPSRGWKHPRENRVQAEQ